MLIINGIRWIFCWIIEQVSPSQVQSDHFDEFFAPELEKHGYLALYKRKTTEVIVVYLCI